MRIWPALESLVGPAAVLAEWRELVGEELPLLMPYLQPRPKLATSFPRLMGRLPGNDYRVVELGPDDIVGVCDETQERVPLLRQDLVVYGINWHRLAGDIARAFGIEPAGILEPAVNGIRFIGRIRPSAGFAFPVYLVVPMERATAFRAIAFLLTSVEGPFILLLPTNRKLQPDGRNALVCRKSCCLALSESLEAAGPGKWEVTDNANRGLQAFIALNVPVVEDSNRQMVYFPTPANATWNDVTIRFIDGHTVAIRVGAVSGVYHFTQLGMADGRNAKPTKQWDLLTVFAKNSGLLTWKSPDAHRKNKKRRELLARDLKAFFRIDGEPIEPTDDGKGWRTGFGVSPDC